MDDVHRNSAHPKCCVFRIPFLQQTSKWNKMPLPDTSVLPWKSTSPRISTSFIGLKVTISHRGADDETSAVGAWPPRSGVDGASKKRQKYTEYSA